MCMPCSLQSLWKNNNRIGPRYKVDSQNEINSSLHWSSPQMHQLNFSFWFSFSEYLLDAWVKSHTTYKWLAKVHLYNVIILIWIVRLSTACYDFLNLLQFIFLIYSTPKFASISHYRWNKKFDTNSNIYIHSMVWSRHCTLLLVPCTNYNQPHDQVVGN